MEPKNIMIVLVVLLSIVLTGFMIGVLSDTIPMSDEYCHNLEGGYDKIHKWCDCERKWWGEPFNESYIECHAKDPLVKV